LILVRMTAYIGIAGVVSWFVLPKLLNRLEKIPEIAGSHGMTAIALILIFFFAWSAETLGGVAGITGAFLCGLGLGRTRERLRENIESTTSAIAYGFLVPIFFIDVGLEADLSGFPISALPFAMLLLVVAIVSKLIGCGGGGLLGGFKPLASLRLGVCMISRGEVGLIIASLGLNIGVFRRDDPLFAAVFLVILLTTLIAPVLVRLVFLGDQPSRSKMLSV
jgi:Kef-type K+ transport system membrane component KefB